jgi:mannitol-1-/sugar-/sorbitol-6-phosphatase
VLCVDEKSQIQALNRTQKVLRLQPGHAEQRTHDYLTMSVATMLIPGRALLFDCDGVLVDSDASVVSAWSRWASRYALNPAEVVVLVHGRRSGDTVSALIDPDRQDEALKLINEFEIEDASTVRAIPGAKELLSTVPAGSWAVVTSGLTRLAQARMSGAGLPLPSVLVTADLVGRGKPEPEGYLMAANRLGVPAGECIVVEDAVDGVLAARAAKVGAVVGVGPRVSQAEVDAHVSDLTPLAWAANGLSILEASASRHLDLGLPPVPSC